jgi:hypothetical protein
MEVRLEGDPDPRGGPSQVHRRLIDEYATHFPRVGADPKIGPSPCTHLHIETWLLLMGPRALAARLSEGPEKWG